MLKQQHGNDVTTEYVRRTAKVRRDHFASPRGRTVSREKLEVTENMLHFSLLWSTIGSELPFLTTILDEGTASSIFAATADL